MALKRYLLLLINKNWACAKGCLWQLLFNNDVVNEDRNGATSKTEG